MSTKKNCGYLFYGDGLHPNHNILIDIGSNMRDLQWHGVKVSDDMYIDEIKKAGIYDWWLRDKLIEEREQKLKRILGE